MDKPKTLINRKKNTSFYMISQKGLSQSVVQEISQKKNEPGWMTDFRLKSLDLFLKLPMPNWGPDLSGLDPNDLFYYIKHSEGQKRTWHDVPEHIKKTFERLGVPQAERELLSGVGAQFDSEMIYKSLRKTLQEQGVVFCDLSDGLKNYPEIFKKYFAKIVPPNDNKFAALNSAVWSGGNFVYVPEGVDVQDPLQAYFRIDSEKFGQFERTLIIAEPGSKINYVEGCSAPVYRAHSLHSAVVEIVALQNSTVHYSTIQNWSGNVYNLVTKRAVAHKNSVVKWIDGNFGSKVTMKYPCIILSEPGAKGEVVSISVAKKNQHQDSGAKIIHLASRTTSHVISKSICKDGGRTSYRGLVKVAKGAKETKSKVVCESLILDGSSRADTYPKIDVQEKLSSVEHEASASKINQEKLFYLMLRGIGQQEACGLIVNGFLDPFVSKLPMEYAVEINKLIDMEMEGSVG